jgi:hypothetical protein
MKPHYKTYEFKYPKEYDSNYNPAYANFGAEKIMSNKFLPFITEDSNAESVFKAIIHRSKGIPEKDLISIYSAIMHLGAAKVKSYVSTLQQSLTSGEVLSAIASNYRTYSIPVAHLAFWKFIVLNYGYTKIKNFDNYSFQELSIMVAVLINFNEEKLETIGIDQNAILLSKYLENSFNWDIANLVNMKFTHKGKKVGFCSFTEFKAYVAYIQENHNNLMYEIYPVFITTSNEVVDEESYKRHLCESPYKNYKIPEEAEDEDIPF